MGTNQDLYVVQEKASDQYYGRIVAGLPEHCAEFPVSDVDFVALDPTVSLNEGVTEADHREQQVELDQKVHQALSSIFGEANLQKFPLLGRYFELALHVIFGTGRHMTRMSVLFQLQVPRFSLIHLLCEALSSSLHQPYLPSKNMLQFQCHGKGRVATSSPLLAFLHML